MRTALTLTLVAMLVAQSARAQERDGGDGEGEVGARVGFWLAQEVNAPYGALTGAMRFNDHALLVAEVALVQFDESCDFDAASGSGGVGCGDARIGFATIGPRFEMGNAASRPFLSLFLGSTFLEGGFNGVVGGGAGVRIDRPSGFAVVPEATLQWISRSGGFQIATVLSLGIVYAP